nr:PBP1A family penicillin-binding protein [Desulforhopalus vacuolatus]
MFTENRTFVPLSQMSKYLAPAFIAAEDGAFFEHGGLDFFSMLRALLNNLQSGRRGQGGSTITQQVTKSILLTPEKTWIRKIREAILATRIDREFSKAEILQIYLNQIYLGEGAFGVEAAAQTYFGKSAAQLNLGECALLAGLPQAPSRYSLFDHEARAAERQRYVLNRMTADGYITPKQARVVWAMPVHLNRHRQRAGEQNGYYLDEVKKQARELIGAPLQTSGARIYTWLDSALQKRALQAVAQGIAGVKARAGGGSTGKTPEAALVALETKTGRVRALIGGASFAASPFNRATQAHRPAGSTFKPFLYAAALKAGWRSDSRILDAPLSIRGGNGRIWTPKNYNNKYLGEVTLLQALTQSLNTAAVRLMRRVGWEETVAIATQAGIPVKMPQDLSLALGAVDLSPLQLTSAYTIFADHGIYHPPSFISKIVLEDGRIIRPQGVSQRVLSKNIAAEMQGMLHNVVVHGTGNKAWIPGILGGKTGTSDNSRDAWFVGFTRKMVAGVWIGYDYNQPMGHESGGRTAAPVWHMLMKGD